MNVLSECTAAVVAAGAILAAGCIGGDIGSDFEGIDNTQQHLYTDTSTELIPGGTVQVCFWPVRETTKAGGPRTYEDGDLSDPDYIAAKADFKEVVESTFETPDGVGIDLWGWKDCPSGALGSFVGGIRVSLELTPSGAAFRHCAVGDTYPMGSGCSGGSGYTATEEMTIHMGLGAGRTPGAAYSAADWPMVAAHEVVHALGFGDEKARAAGIGTKPSASRTRIGSPCSSAIQPVSARSISPHRMG